MGIGHTLLPTQTEIYCGERHRPTGFTILGVVYALVVIIGEGRIVDTSSVIYLHSIGACNIDRDVQCKKIILFAQQDENKTTKILVVQINLLQVHLPHTYKES